MLAGLCDSCAHQRVVGNTRGSSFSLCERSRTDDRYPRYPRVPVASCGGYEQRAAQRLSVRVGVSYGGSAEGPGGNGLWPFVETLEREGYDSLWLADTPNLGGLAPLPALAAVAGRTDRLKLGCNVLALPPRHPLALARELATVDALSGGRLLPAGGLGAQPAEMEALGVPRDERAARMEECIGVLGRLWTGEQVSHRGRFYSLEDVTLTPHPVSEKLELWLGGRAPAALRRIGRMADGWLGAFVTPAEFGGMADTIRAAAAGAGRSIDEDHYGTTLLAAPAEDELPPFARRLLALGRDIPRAEHVAFGLEELRALLWRFREQGATKFVVVPLARDPLDWLRRLREVIVPFEAEA